MRKRITARAPGKVNLSLAVAAAGADGYHPIATVFQAISLFDDVTLQAADEFSLTVSGDDEAMVPDDASNLAWQAVELVAAEYGIDEAAAIHIHKTIPVAGGMAGGSADAAAAIVAADELWDLGMTPADMHRLAAQLGSDVPFALTGHTAIGLGRGTELTQVLGRGTFHWVFATQGFGLSTPEVFGEFDAAEREQELTIEDDLLAALRAGDPLSLGKTLRNDLQPAAIRLAPALADTIAVAHEAGALGAVVSGSGPTVAALALSNADCLRIASALDKVADRVLTAHGPVAGARLVS